MVAFSPDGRRAASMRILHDGQGRRTFLLEVWDVKAGRRLVGIEDDLLSVFSGENLLGALAFSPDGLRLAGYRGDGTVKIWDAEDGEELASFDAAAPGTSVGDHPC
jgi:WD40 repeat protein